MTGPTPFTPETALDPGETVLAQFPSDRATYWREHAWMAAMAMAFGMVVLAVIGNPFIWTGAVGGLFAIAVRGLYLASDETRMRWDLTDRRMLGPGTRVIALDNIAAVNTIFSAVQLVTVTGDKHLLKYQADAKGVKAEIDAARGRA